MDTRVIVFDDGEPGCPWAFPAHGDARVCDVGAVGQEQVRAHRDGAAPNDVEVIEDVVSVRAMAQVEVKLFDFEAFDRACDREEFVMQVDRP